MTSVFEHIGQTRYLLFQLFESGFVSGRGIEDGLSVCEKSAAEMGLSHGAELLRALAKELTALRAGRGQIGGAALLFSNLVSYYDMVSAMLMTENITVKSES